MVGIIGIGITPLRELTPDSSYREMTYEAAIRAYEDAGVEPKDVDAFISVAEDYTEGVSIFDEYSPDQVGAVLKPMHTIPGDGLHGIASGCMLIETGTVRIAMIEAHSKASNIVNENIVNAYALEPLLLRPLKLNPVFLAGVEAQALCEAGLLTEMDMARVVVKNKRNALKNPFSAYPELVDIEIVTSSPYVAEPIREYDISRKADCAICVLLANEDIARLNEKTVWIKGIGWCSEGQPDTRDFTKALYAEKSAEIAYKMARIARKEIDFAEVDDTFSFKEILHIEALHLVERGRARFLLEDGFFEREGSFPVNPSGGTLGAGHLNEATGLLRLIFCTLQLRGEAKGFQVEAKMGLCMSWRGIPTATGAVAILEGKD